MIRIAIVSKPSDEAEKAASLFSQKLKRMGLEHLALIPFTSDESVDLNSYDAIFAFGGDGTILKAARMFTSKTPLIVGVNYGRLGFLAEVEPSQVDQALEKVLDGNYSYYKIDRMVMTVLREGKRILSPPVMNDIYVAPNQQARMVTLKIEVPNLFVYKGRMDGLLLSTALGSTAYSLSAGGPIVDPDSEVNIITPMSPINIALKPVVVDRKKTINIVNVDTQPVSLFADGVKWLELEVGEYVQVSCFEYPVKLYRSKTDLLKKLFDKRLSWDHSP